LGYERCANSVLNRLQALKLQIFQRLMESSFPWPKFINPNTSISYCSSDHTTVPIQSHIFSEDLGLMELRYLFKHMNLLSHRRTAAILIFLLLLAFLAIPVQAHPPADVSLSFD
jgi:hypothetical protein